MKTETASFPLHPTMVPVNEKIEALTTAVAQMVEQQAGRTLGVIVMVLPPEPQFAVVSCSNFDVDKAIEALETYCTRARDLLRFREQMAHASHILKP